MMFRFLAVGLLLVSFPAWSQTYFARVVSGNVEQLMEASASGASVPPSCPGCVVVSEAQYQDHVKTMRDMGRSKIVDKDAFLSRFSPTEITAINARAETNATIRKGLLFMKNRVDVTDPDIVGMVDAAISTRDLAANRKNTILAP